MLPEIFYVKSNLAVLEPQKCYFDSFTRCMNLFGKLFYIGERHKITKTKNQDPLNMSKRQFFEFYNPVELNSHKI